MDPDECLKEIRELRREVWDAKNEGDASYAGTQLAEKVEALDEWLSKGGFFPRAWQKRRSTLANVALHEGGVREAIKEEGE